MAPRNPFTRTKPASTVNGESNEAGPSNYRQNNGPSERERGGVVSASGRSPANLSVVSPTKLRSRNSPRNPESATPSTFQSDQSLYPSPAAYLLRGKSKKRANGESSSDGKGGWMELSGDSPTKDTTGSPSGSGHGYGYGNENKSASGTSSKMSVPRFDSRGYPTREGESGSSTPLRSVSRGSMISISTAGAGLDEETTMFTREYMTATPDRPSTYYAQGHGETVAGASIYPPMSYNLSEASCDPYNPNPMGFGANNPYGQGTGNHPGPLPSLYGDSKVSLASMRSEDSMTHFRKFDAMQDSYGAFSMSSRGGKRRLGEVFTLPPDPATWSYLGPEADDDFHDPDVKSNKQTNVWRSLFTVRGAANIGCLFFLVLAVVALFGAYPLISALVERSGRNLGGYNLGGINATGQIPNVGPFQLIDRDTPESAYTHTSYETGETWELVFSDEFNNPGRTFWPGDDPYWEAVDLHYWQTNNLEWYEPRRITTVDGHLRVTLDKFPSHGLDYEGGMIQTWNRFCFTGGYIEASVSLPGRSNVYGLWPAVWTMGNLGRAGYGGSLDGMWPYTYDSCDVGTLKNQSLNGVPEIAYEDGDFRNLGHLSYLPGQRLSACTCPDDPDHPGPKRENGSFVGRGAPEIDMFEAAVDQDTRIGDVSQTGQWAPFNPGYTFANTSANYHIVNRTRTHINDYSGGVYQQAVSGLSVTNQECYTGMSGCYSIYGFEYKPARDGYITWVNDGDEAWTMRAPAMGPNAKGMVGQRLISEEPMYILVNLGISENFGAVDYEGLEELWPVHMDIDYIRVYQDPNARNIGCDPPNMPTSNYIARHPSTYANSNITTEAQIPDFTIPKNRLIDTC